MSAFSIMAHALAQELAARGLNGLSPADCEEILRRVTDQVSAVASCTRQAPAAIDTPRDDH
jgi:hypothetical protein